MPNELEKNECFALWQEAVEFGAYSIYFNYIKLIHLFQSFYILIFDFLFKHLKSKHLKRHNEIFVILDLPFINVKFCIIF